MKWNKSSTYLLAFIAREEDNISKYATKKNYPTNLYFNSYIAHTEDNYKFPCLLLVYKKVDNPIYTIFEDKLLLSNPNFIETKKETEHLISYLFKIPDEFVRDYEQFVAGKYSHISYEGKKRICKFLNLIKYEDESRNSDVVNVLYRTEYLRKKISKTIGYQLSSIDELSSTIYLEEETFDPKKYVTNEEKKLV